MSPLARMYRGFVSVLVGNLIFATGASAVVVFTVNSTDDVADFEPGNGKCSTTPTPTPPYICTLRAAVMEANRTPNDGATITLPAGTYTLLIDPHDNDGEDNGDLNLSVPSGYAPGPTIINGAGAASTIIDANGIDRVFSVDKTRSGTISGVTLRNGVTAGYGGGIASLGESLTLNQVVLSHNQAAAEGGGIYNALGMLNVIGNTLSDNISGTGGGAIWNSGNLEVSFSTFSLNTATTGNGGGIYSKGTLILDHSTLSVEKAATFGGGIFTQGQIIGSYCTLAGNTASSGAGIFVDIGGIVSLQFCTLSGNTASDGGGGLASFYGETGVQQSTISGNFAHHGGGIANASNLYVANSTISGNHAATNGGGIENNGTANVYNATIVFNQANADVNLSGMGGGFYNSPGGAFSLRNSVVAGNYLDNPPIDDDCSGAFDSYGRNKYWVAGGGASCSRTHIGPGSDTLLLSLAELGPLQDNGGPTKTHALVPPSNMIDGAESTLGCIDNNVDTSVSPLLHDQRDYPRVNGVRCDIGAFELQEAIFTNGFELYN